MLKKVFSFIWILSRLFRAFKGLNDNRPFLERLADVWESEYGELELTPEKIKSAESVLSRLPAFGGIESADVFLKSLESEGALKVFSKQIMPYVEKAGGWMALRDLLSEGLRTDSVGNVSVGGVDDRNAELIPSMPEAFGFHGIVSENEISERVKYLVIHCTAGNPSATAKAVQDFFVSDPEKGGRGWSRGGYHVIIESSGRAVEFYEPHTITNGTLPASGVANSNSYHISYIGGRTPGEITSEQLSEILALVRAMIAQYPEIKILGHNQISRKACPNFSVPKTLRAAGIPDENILEKDAYGIAANLPAAQTFV